MNILDELRREFPGWTIGLRAGGKTAKCWKHGDEPPASQVDDYALVSEADGVFLGTPLGDSEAQTFPTLLEAAEYALGEKAESTKAREGAAIKADEPREYDNGDPETEADKASFAEFARLAPFRNAWPEWTWASPDADTYIGEVGGETWTCQREPGDSFRAHSSLCSAVCYRDDAYQAMRAMMAWPGAERSTSRKDFTTKPRLTLIPAGVLARHLLPVLHDGAKKHGRDHWRKCSAREYAEAAASHLLAFLDGQDIDESGHHSLAHAMADCALALGTLDKDTTP